MNGPEHYKEAERLIERSRGVSLDDGHAAYLASCAQAHAMLAQVAATALVNPQGAIADGWGEVIR